MYSEAASIFMERFPRLRLRILEEAPKIVPGKAEVIYFYGLCPDIYNQCQGRTLIFLADDPEEINSFLHRPEAIEILADKNVHIALLSEIDTIIEQFPAQRVEVFGL